MESTINKHSSPNNIHKTSKAWKRVKTGCMKLLPKAYRKYKLLIVYPSVLKEQNM